MRKIIFLLATFLSMSLVACGYSSSGYSPAASSVTPAASSYSISGTVTRLGAPVLGATITLTGASSTSTTTDTNGYYSFTSLANGAYVVTPSGLGYTYTPTSTPVTVNGANMAGTDFTAA